ncbi:glycosyltransferase family 4 protein [Neobacillus soli]|uniref:glycosyltransferase family 4 protein n=1 Tax=Neobacillus soli TaxID=220688 RepID=UPI0008269700|nr:glycosyltransferase family 4 protein [Neobacillus soli]
MKILMICTEKLPVPPVLGGAIQTYISGTLPILSKFHDITVIGISHPSLPDKEINNGIQYVRVPGIVLEIYREAVVRFVQNNSFDLIHIFNRPRLVMPIRGAAPNAKITLSMHNDMFNIEKIDPTEATAALKEVSNIVTVSDYIGNVIRTLYPDSVPNIRTIYSGVDTERFLPGNHPEMREIRNSIRKQHGLENKTVLLFAGRLSVNKGVDRLIRALPQLSTKFKDLALVVVGSKWFSQDEVTDYVAYIKALAKKQSIPVVATGFVSPGEIQNWFGAADLFVCTSLWQEPLARVHYEAMAAGLPIVTTARGGNPEVIIQNENGLIVENPENPSCFAEKIATILSDKSLMKIMGIRGRELAVAKYEWNRVANEILEVWQQSIEAPLTNIQQNDPEFINNPQNDLEPKNAQQNDLGYTNIFQNQTLDQKVELESEFFRQEKNNKKDKKNDKKNKKNDKKDKEYNKKDKKNDNKDKKKYKKDQKDK